MRGQVTFYYPWRGRGGNNPSKVQVKEVGERNPGGKR